MKHTKLRRHMNSAQIIILGFAALILCGALLLMLPIASQSRTVTPFHETLLTATSASCVTGLVVRSTGAHWSLFGQIVILFLIQIGGLGRGHCRALLRAALGTENFALSAQRHAGFHLRAAGRRHRPHDLAHSARHALHRGHGNAPAPAVLLPPLWRKGHLVRAVSFDFGVLQRGL